MTSSALIQIGTRGSALALAQARIVADRLADRGTETALEVITSDGDRDKTTPLTELGGRGVFASSLQQALLAGRIDLAVHSAKDLPTVRPHGLAIAAFLARDDPRDVLVSRHGLRLTELPPAPVIATSSRRRMAQILAIRPDAQCVDLRGNIDTRLRRAFESDLDGIVLAAAGIARLGWSAKVTEFLDPEIFVTAPGQAALAIEIRAADRLMAALAGDLDESEVRIAVELERVFLSELGAGCTIPVGAQARVFDGDQIELRAMVARDINDRPVWRTLSVSVAEAEVQARALAREMQAETGADRAVLQSANAWHSLLGKTVLVTRPTNDDDPLAAEIRLAGGVPLASPTISIEGRALGGADLDVIRSFGAGDFDWVAFTSSHGVRYFAEAIARAGVSIPAGTRVAVVGEGTADTAMQAGFRIDHRADVASGRVLGDSLSNLRPRPANVLIARGSLARPDFPQSMRRSGILITELTVYDTLPAQESNASLIARLLRNEIDAITLLSPSAVDGLKAHAGEQWDRARVLPAVCIGETTVAAGSAAGMVNLFESETASVKGIVTALQDLFRSMSDRVAPMPARIEGGNDAP